MIIERKMSALQLSEDKQLCERSLIFGEHIVADKHRLGRCLCHGTHQSHIKHEQLEGV